MIDVLAKAELVSSETERKKVAAHFLHANQQLLS